MDIASDPAARANAEETEVLEGGSDFAKVEETVGGAIPVGLSTDSDVVNRYEMRRSPGCSSVSWLS